MAETSGSRIRLLVALATGEIPAWQRDLLIRLRNAQRIDVRAVIALQGAAARTKAPALLRTWKWLDDRLFLRNWPAECRSERRIRPDFQVDHGASTAGRQFDAEVVVWLCPDRPPAEILERARYGVLTIAGACHSDFGVADFIARRPASECHVIRLGESPLADSVVATGAATTDRLSLCRGLAGLRAVANSLLVATVSRLRRHPADGALQPATGHTAVPQDQGPGFFRLLAGLGVILVRYVVSFPRRFFAFDQWQMAYRIGGDRLDQRGMTRLAPSHGGFWADPFMIEWDGRKVLFFEEFSEQHGRGHIAAMAMRSDGRFDPPVDVLKRPYHLSYPFLFTFDGSVFMIPECAEARKVEVFRCTRFPSAWESHAVLLDDICAFDTTLVEHEGSWWMFLTVQRGCNSPNDELHLYYAESPFGEWKAHPLNPIGLDVRHSRPAGQLFRREGRLFRPAQDCSGRYGRAIVIREVLRMTRTDYEEATVETIPPAWADGAHATHTVNQAAGVTVYDCEVRRRK